MTKKQHLYSFLLIVCLLTPFASACKEQYSPAENVTIIDTIVPEGLGATCTINVFNETTNINNGTMIQNGLVYSHNSGLLPIGTYTAGINCTSPTGTTYRGECKFKVMEEDSMIIGMIILIPLIFSILLIIGAVTLDNEEHAALKIGLFLLSIIPLFISFRFGLIAVAKFYNFPELQDAIGSTVFNITLLFGFLMSYFIIYLVWKMFAHMAQEKKARLQY